MKSVLSILLLFSFLIVNMSKSIILVNYELNKAEITAKYCINKDKPMLHCCGKCLLKRKLAEQEEQQKLPAYPDNKTDIQLYCSESLLNLYSSQINKTDLIPANRSLLTLFEGNSVFHPPCC